MTGFRKTAKPRARVSPTSRSSCVSYNIIPSIFAPSAFCHRRTTRPRNGLFASLSARFHPHRDAVDHEFIVAALSLISASVRSTM
jgi:hypothetical protein